MRMVISVDDNCVLVNGSPWPVDLSAFEKNGISAVQVYDGPAKADGWAEIEYAPAQDGKRKANVKIFEGHPKHAVWWDLIMTALKTWQEKDAEQRLKEMEAERAKEAAAKE